MSFPLPSFPRIRLIVLILGFFILFFFTGFVRWCFAAKECYFLGRFYNAGSYTFEYIETPQAAGMAVDGVTELGPNATIIMNEETVAGYWTGRWYLIYFDTQTETWLSELNGDGNMSPSFFNSLESIENDFQLSRQCEYVACDVQEQQFLDSCPHKMGTYSCETQSGECYEPSSCNELEQIVRETICANQDYSFTCNVDNEGNIESSDYECKDCMALATTWADDNCNGLANVNNWDCETPDQGTCKDYNCNDLLAQCYDQCNNQVDNFSCDDSSGTATVSVPCDCQTITPEIANGQTGDEPPPGQDPDTTTPESAETDPNAKVAAANTQILVEINSKELPEIRKSVQANGAKIDTTNDTLKSIEDKLDNNLDGFYNKETITNDYSINESLNETSQFTTRFDSFITNVKATPLFSLPNQVLFNIPNSTESAYTIEMGQYGQAEIDLANYAAPLLILRAAFLLCFSYAGLRIVVSKK